MSDTSGPGDDNAPPTSWLDRLDDVLTLLTQVFAVVFMGATLYYSITEQYTLALICLIFGTVAIWRGTPRSRR